MRDKVRDFINGNRLLSHGDSVIVALSGGADSVSLLHVLSSLGDEYDLKIYAAHFNHMIRGAEADRDEAFVSELCGRMGVELFTERADVPAVARESKESLELCGRRLRYAFLSELSEKLGAKIATAHNLNDNTETVLMNLLRGTGVAGLKGIPVERDGIIRPLLCCQRDMIEVYCKDNGLAYVTDSTNLDDGYTRNKLRLNILPALREMNPALDESVMRMADVMRETDDYLNDISEKELKSCRSEHGYSCEKLLKLPSTVLAYALRNLVSGKGISLDSVRTRLIIEAMKNGSAVEIGGGMRADCSQGTLRIVPTAAEKSPRSEVEIPFFDYEKKQKFIIKGGRVYCSDRESSYPDEKINKKFFNNCIPCDIITRDTAARGRRAGDTFTDARRGLTKTVKKLLNELKIPREERGRLTLIANGSTVLWLEGVGTSAAARIGEGYEGEVYHIDGGRS